VMTSSRAMEPLLLSQVGKLFSWLVNIPI